MITLNNKSDTKTWWNILFQYFPSLLALATILYGILSSRNQRILAQDQIQNQSRIAESQRIVAQAQIDTQLKIAEDQRNSQKILAQKEIDERSMRKFIDDIIAKVDNIVQLSFQITNKSLDLNSSSDELLNIIKDLNYHCVSLALYIPSKHPKAKSIAQLSNEYRMSALQIYNRHLDKEGDNTNRLKDISTSIQTTLALQQQLYILILEVIDETRAELDKLLS